VTRTAPVAVVILARDAAAFLPVTLDSLAQQTARPEQVIVVDGGSRDDTAAIAERAGATLIRADGSGAGAARNRGLAAARAEYVGFLDADDWYALDKIERSLDHLRDLGAACLGTDAWLVVGDRVERRANHGRVVPAVLTMEQLLLLGNPIACSSVLAARAAVLDAGGFDENDPIAPCADYDLWLRLARREPIAYLPEPLTFRRVRGGAAGAPAGDLRGVDLVLDKVALAYAGEAHFLNLVRRRRAGVRVDAAAELLRDGRRQQARALLAEARQHARTWRGCWTWLRSLSPL